MSNQTIVRIKIAAAILGVLKKHLHELVKRLDFPRKVKIGANAVRWRASHLEAWIEIQIVEGGSNNAP